VLEIALTSKILGPPKIGGPRLKPFQPNGKSAPDHITDVKYTLGQKFKDTCTKPKDAALYAHNSMSNQHSCVILHNCAILFLYILCIAMSFHFQFKKVLAWTHFSQNQVNS